MFRSGAFAKNAENSLACVFSVQGLELSSEERDLFASVNPFGFILFGRNIDSPQQVEGLCADLKEVVGRDCPILIDQEGGRVQRLKPPHWGIHKPMKYYGDLLSIDPKKSFEELKNDTDRISDEVLGVGINVNCAPVLDVLFEATHEVIGDRAFSSDPDVVSKLAMVICGRYLINGLTPIVKHIPGHGRAAADSHLELPVVDASLEELEKTDFYPFGLLAHCTYADALWAMSAHIIYSAIDAELPATLSSKVISEVIRGSIGFDGILIGDDLDMKALDQYGSVAERCVKTLEAGCDLALYCWADLKIMQEIAETCPKLRPDTLKRLQKAEELWESAA